MQCSVTPPLRGAGGVSDVLGVDTYRREELSCFTRFAKDALVDVDLEEPIFGHPILIGVTRHDYPEPNLDLFML